MPSLMNIKTERIGKENERIERQRHLYQSDGIEIF